MVSASTGLGSNTGRSGGYKKRGQAEQGLVAVEGGEQVLAGQRAGLAASGMTADLFAELAPGLPLLLGQAVPAERGAPEV